MICEFVLLFFFLLVQDISSLSYWRPRCKAEYKIAWWPIPPYIYIENGSIIGAFPEIMSEMVQDCCQAPVNLSYDLVVDNKVEAVEHVINGTADFVLPLTVKNGKKKFLSFPLVALVESPGVAFYSSSPLSAGEALAEILLQSIPILILMVVLVLISGTLYWLIELRNKTAIIPGVFDGMWWAFVSMTTVGYGDISPKSKKAKMMAIFWILIGLIACSLFVAVVSSVLTMTCLSQKLELRGNKIAVIEGGQEHSLAIRKSALPIGVSRIEDMAQSLDDGASVGALLDSYVAGFHQNMFNKFRLNDLQEDLFSYGVVLMPSVMKYERCLRDFVSSNHEFLSQVVSQNIKPLKTTTNRSTAEEMSRNMFRFNSVPTYVPILVLFGSFILISSICFFKEIIISKRKFDAMKKKVSCLDHHCSDSAYLQEIHMREVTEYLQQMLRETQNLQEVCNQAILRADIEARPLRFENRIIVETCL